MTIQINVSIDADKAKNMLNSVKNKMISELGEATYDICNKYKNNLVSNIRAKNLIWRGDLLNGTKARRISTNTSHTVMPPHGVKVDSMDRHTEHLVRGSSIRQWALTKPGIAEHIKRIAINEGHITVNSTPFIVSSFNSTMVDVPSIVQRRADKAMREAE